MHGGREIECREMENVCAVIRDRVSSVCPEEDLVANGRDSHEEETQSRFFVCPAALLCYFVRSDFPRAPEYW